MSERNITVWIARDKTNIHRLFGHLTEPKWHEIRQEFLSDARVFQLLAQDFPTIKPGECFEATLGLNWTPIKSEADLPVADVPFFVTINSGTYRRVERCAHRQGVWFLCDAFGECVGYLTKQENVIAYTNIETFGG